MTADTLSASAAILLSLAFSYIPPLNQYYQQLDATAKRLVMLIALLVTAAGAFTLTCAGFASVLGLPLSCDTPGALGLLRALIAALVANQATYALSPRKGSV